MGTDGSCILLLPISVLTAPATTYYLLILICKQHLQNYLDTKECVSDIFPIIWLQLVLFILYVLIQGETVKYAAFLRKDMTTVTKEINFPGSPLELYLTCPSSTPTC